MRIVGYYGLSSRFDSQRQSGVVETAIQTGTPNAPARGATAVSEVMKRSTQVITAAVSMNGPVSPSSRLPMSITSNLLAI
jgi:hypothetical protein